MASLTTILTGAGATESGGTWSNDSSATGYTFATGVTGDSDTVSGHTATTCLEAKLSGKSHAVDANWVWQGTWENLGIPAGSTVTNVQLIYDWKCSAFTTGGTGNQLGVTSTDGNDALTNGGTSITNFTSTATTFSATTAWATKTDSNIAVPSALQASSSTIQVHLAYHLATGNSNSAVVTLHLTYIQIVMTYTAGAGSLVFEPRRVVRNSLLRR